MPVANNRTLKKAMNLRKSFLFSYREISRIIGISKSRVYQLLNPRGKDNSSKDNSRKQSVVDIPINISSVVQMSKDGRSIRVIAGMLGIPKTRVWRILKKYGPVHN